MSVMGVKIDQFKVPVCNSFKAKIIRDQLCYDVDPNDYKDKLKSKEKMSLSIFISYNEDRINENKLSLQDSSITINTIGNLLLKVYH